MDWNTLLTPVIVAGVPIVVAGIKRVLAPVPWVLPPLAAGLGVAADAIAAYALNQPVNPMAGVVLGLAGVGLRELTSNITRK